MIKYNKKITDLVVLIYGKQSEIYQKMINGECISALIKDDIKKKNRNAFKRIKDKKELFRLCVKAEDLHSLKTEALFEGL